MEKKKPQLRVARLKLDDPIDVSNCFTKRDPTPEELAYARATLKRAEAKLLREPSDK